MLVGKKNKKDFALRLGAAMAVSLTMPVLAESDSGEVSGDLFTFEDWVVRCYEFENALPCDMYQSVAHQETNAKIISLSLAYSPQHETHAVQITLPLGIDLRRGVSLKVGEVSVAGIRPVRCELQGCMIEAVLAPDMLGAMNNSDVGEVAVF